MGVCMCKSARRGRAFTPTLFTIASDLFGFRILNWRVYVCASDIFDGKIKKKRRRRKYPSCLKVPWTVLVVYVPTYSRPGVRIFLVNTSKCVSQWMGGQVFGCMGAWVHGRMCLLINEAPFTEFDGSMHEEMV
jgi:hypothetical protein